MSTSVRRTSVVTVLLILAVLASLLQTLPARAATRPVGPLVPSTGALLGAHVPPADGDWSRASQEAAVTNREASIGRKLAVVESAYSFTSTFPTWRDSWHLSNGRTPLVTWGGADVTAVASGLHDDIIKARAAGLAALGKPVFLRWHKNVDASGAPALTFVAAHQRIHGLFRAAGATNVVFVWSASAKGFAEGRAQAYYPGDSYVDWIAADGYNWAPSRAGASYDSLWTIFNPFYKWAATSTKPLMIAATAAQERAAGEKANWIGAARASLKNAFPNVVAFLWHDVAAPVDWRVDTSAEAMSAFKNLVADPYFKTGAATTTAPAPSPVLAPATGALFGAYTPPANGDWTQASVKSALAGYEQDLGRTLDVAHWFYAFDEPFPSWRESHYAAGGRIPMVSWAGASSTSINSGSQDAVIRARADAVKAFGGKIMIRYFWEMDAGSNATKAGTPEEYKAAWQRIVSIFDSRGATNALWVWCATAYGFTNGKAATYYPGAASVDWVAADGYNWAPTKLNSTWRSFGDIFADFYTWGTASGKPLMVAETGVLERNAGEKAAWYDAARSKMKTGYPGIKAFVYFDSNTTSYTDGDTIFYWRSTTSTGARDAFRNMARDPWFNPA